MRRSLACLLLFAPLPALAQNTSGVPGPTVEAGASAAAYRLAVSAGDDRGARAAHRLQVEHGVTDALRLRVVGQALTSDGDARPEYLQLDALWQVTGDEAPLQLALRFDARVQDGPRPERLGVVGIGQVAVSDALSLRGSIHLDRDVGDLARSGVSVETRGGVIYDLGQGRKVGVEAFHDHGRTPDPEPFEGRQQAGPFVEWPVGEGWSLDTGVLFGLSEETQKFDLRLFVGRDL